MMKKIQGLQAPMELHHYSSIFLTTKLIADLKERVNLTYHNNFNWAIVDYCLDSESVYLNADKGHPNFTYVCEDTFKALSITLPFSNFKCAILAKMNVALIQLHPNSWAFMKIFLLSTTISTSFPFSTNLFSSIW